jgi:3,5-epimerase/4-reductase
MAEFSEQREVYLLFGRNGWIGGKIIDLLTAQGKTFYLAESRTYNREAVVAEVEKYNPTHILNAAGVTGRPNVDWCEDHRLETIRSNVIGTLTVADVAEEVSDLFSRPPSDMTVH